MLPTIVLFLPVLLNITSSDFNTNRSFGSYEVELTSNNVYRIDHYTAAVFATYGLGAGNTSGGDNIYTTVDIAGS